MKYIRQFCIILLVTFAGEALHGLLPLPIPAGIYGLLLLLCLLLCRVISLDQVEECADFLVAVMPLMFIPSAAGLLDSWGLLQEFFLEFLVTIVLSTWIVMAVSGKVTQWILDWKERHQ